VCGAAAVDASLVAGTIKPAWSDCRTYSRAAKKSNSTRSTARTGTANAAPGRPPISPPAMTARNTSSGWTLTASPWIRGVRMLPSIWLMTRYAAAVRTAASGEMESARVPAGIAPSQAPRYGRIPVAAVYNPSKSAYGKPSHESKARASTPCTAIEISRPPR
jgi:hypothetical protein